MPGLWRRVLIVAGALMAAELLIWFGLLRWNEFWWLLAGGLGVTLPAVYLFWWLHYPNHVVTMLPCALGYTWAWYVVFAFIWMVVGSTLDEPGQIRMYTLLRIAWEVIQMTLVTIPLFTIFGVWLWLPFGLVFWLLLLWQFRNVPAPVGARMDDPSAPSG